MATIWWVAAVMAMFTSGQADWATWTQCSAKENLRSLVPGTPDTEVDWLCLDHCNITTIRTGDFNNIPKLVALDLNDNRIGHIDAGMFDSVPNLRVLRLNNNAFLGKNLSKNLFSNCRELQIIRFSNNDMRDTPVELLQGLDLQSLDLDGCFLGEVPPMITHPTFHSLYYIDLSRNHIPGLCNPGTFSTRLGRLINLELADNNIDYLHEDIFQNLSQLTYLDLSKNKIRLVFENWFRNKTLAVLDLSENLIEYVSAGTFRDTSIFRLNIQQNRLSYLPVDFRLNGFRNEFKFGQNPWQCACLNELLIEVKRVKNKSLGSYEYDRYNFCSRKPACVMTGFVCRRFEPYYELYEKVKKDAE